MKSKIAKKLFSYFFIIMLLNSLVTGGAFAFLGQRNYIKTYKENLVERGENISRALTENSGLFSNENNSHMNRSMGRGNMRGMHLSSAYIRWMNEVLGSNVWIINKDEKVFQRGDSANVIYYDNLTDEEKTVIDKAFSGETVTSESFKSVFDKGSITVATPMKNENGNVLGAILIHEDITSTEGVLYTGLYILFFSAIIGIILASILAIVFANRFISPLKKLDRVSKEMILGDYNVKSNVDQDDEIGELAKNIDELSQRLEKSRIENENLDNMRNDFMANISHELKTPVTVMKGSLEALVEGVIEEEEIPEYHNILYKEIGLLERLVGDLMELSALKNSNFPMNFQEENLIGILNDAVRSQRIIGEEREIELVMDIKDPFVLINCDYARLRQMFVTVIDNGIKFSNKNEKVYIKEYEKDSKVIVEIINRGKPIEKREIENMFVSFYRIKDTRKKGFGLGLAIAKEIALRHNIEINVRSNELDGTVFEFIIPKLTNTTKYD